MLRKMLVGLSGGAVALALAMPAGSAHAAALAGPAAPGAAGPSTAPATAGLSAAPVAVPSSGATAAGYRGELSRLLAAVHAAGMPGVFARVRDGRHSWAGAAGVADLDTGRPARPYLQHRMGSITKSFVATVVLQLVGEGRIRLDAPIGGYLPDVVPGERGRLITVRQLLNHTSGIGNYTTAVIIDEAALERLRTTTYAPRDLAAVGLALPPTNTPGAAHSYSNTNYIVLGMLVEKITGRSVAGEVGRRVLRPLQLRGTYFPGTDMRIRGPHAKAYVPWSNGTMRDFSEFNMSWAWAAGELVSTTDDVNRFYRALFAGRLLRPAQRTELLTTVPLDPGHPAVGGYGLGVFFVALPCGPFWGHNGGVIGQTAISLHSLDGRHQLTLGENLTAYQTDPNQPHPIDLARERFIVAALCGPGTRTAPGPTAAALRLPAVAEPVAHR